MQAINLLPDPQIKNKILHGDFRRAWYAIRYPVLKPIGAAAALLCLIIKGLGIVLICVPIVLVGLLLIILASPLVPFLAIFCIVTVVKRFIAGWDHVYMVVVPCAPTEIFALQRTLLDQFPENDRENRESSLLCENGILCQGTRRSAEWAVRRLREVGIPCHLQRYYGSRQPPYPRVKPDSFQGDVLELLAHFPVLEPSDILHYEN
ncbi:MAG: hypothetical protein QM758_28080 [Armatimonas sp.]